MSADTQRLRFLAAGLPILNNYPGWLAGMIEDHDCGFAVPPENPTAFANALETAAADRLQLKEMGRRVRGLAESEFAREMLAAQWVEWVTEREPLRKIQSKPK